MHAHYRNVPKFSDRQVCANSVDPDQRSSLIRIYTICHSIYIFWMHYSMVKLLCVNFRTITAIFLGVLIFRIFMISSGRVRENLVRTQAGCSRNLLTPSFWYVLVICGYNIDSLSELNWGQLVSAKMLGTLGAGMSY